MWRIMGPVYTTPLTPPRWSPATGVHGGGRFVELDDVRCDQFEIAWPTRSGRNAWPIGADRSEHANDLLGVRTGGPGCAIVSRTRRTASGPNIRSVRSNATCIAVICPSHVMILPSSTTRSFDAVEPYDSSSGAASQCVAAS